MSFFPNHPPPGYVAYDPHSPYPYTPPFTFPPPYAIPIAGAYPLPPQPIQVPQYAPHLPPPYAQPSQRLEQAAPAAPPAAAPAAVAGGFAAGSPAVASGVQVDAYGVPVVPGDVALRYTETFLVEEKGMSMTRDSFTVTDSSGSVRYRVSGSFSLSEMKELRDVHGQTLLRLREARLRLRDRITIFAPNNVPLMTVQKTSLMQRHEKKVHCYLGAHTKPSPDLIATGNENNTHFRIVNSFGTELAVIKRKKYTVKNMIMGRDTYEVTVVAGSPAFMCFMAVVLDEIYED